MIEVLNSMTKFIFLFRWCFLLKFSTEMLIRTIDGTLTHNGYQIYSVLIFNIKNKLKIMEKRLKNIQTFEQHSSELNISDVMSSGY
jgi:hypothetical protein